MGSRRLCIHPVGDISEAELPSGKAWRMIYGSWGAALHEVKDGLINGLVPLGRESIFLFQEAEDHNYFRQAGLAVHFCRASRKVAELINFSRL